MSYSFMAYALNRGLALVTRVDALRALMASWQCKSRHSFSVQVVAPCRTYGHRKRRDSVGGMREPTRNQANDKREAPEPRFVAL